MLAILRPGSGINAVALTLSPFTPLLAILPPGYGINAVALATFSAILRLGLGINVVPLRPLPTILPPGRGFNIVALAPGLLLCVPPFRPYLLYVNLW